MPEQDTIELAREVMRGVDGERTVQEKKQEKKKTEIAPAPQQAIGTPLPEEPAPVDAAPPQETPPGPEADSSDASLPGGAVQPGGEVELKLLVDPDRLADFNDAPIIAANARGKGTRKHLKAVYYDTPERTLWRNGLSLRVRQSGARFVQTVKANGDDPLRRGEWEAGVPSIAPDIALATPFIPAKLRADLQRHPLEAVFTTDIRRHQRMVDLPSGTVEVAFDRGVLKSDDRSVPVSEIELELKSGGTIAIYDLALRLAEHGPVRPSIRSKSERGFDLAANTPPAPSKPQKLRLDPSITLDDAFSAILRSCLCHLLQSLPAAEDGRDPEGVHQLRVALRRLRSALDLMRLAGTLTKLETLRSEARWLAQNLSAARDWDIFQGKTLPIIAKGCPTVSGFDVLDEIAVKRRSAAYKRVRFVLAARRCASFVIGVGGWIEARGWRGDVAPEDLGRLAEPAIDFAQRILSGQYARVARRGRHFKSLAAEEKHRLRLSVKKLRYAADFLLPLCSQRKSARRFYDRLADLQEELGSYNDMATTASLLKGLSADSPDSGPAAAAVAGWQAHALGSVEPRLRNAWRDFSKMKAPWLREAEE
jgi:inorganic triphosphatase YgiF